MAIVREHKGRSIIALPSDYIVIDTETTGLDYEFCELIEISAVKYVNGELSSTFSSLVQPSVSYAYDDEGNEIEEYVNSFITELTGITNEMLAAAPLLDSVIPEFLAFVGNSVLIAHNANFDINFIYDATIQCGQPPLMNDFIDTMRIARKALPHLKHHRLKDIAKEYGVGQPNEHRAEADCIVTAQCYEQMRKAILSRQSEEEFQLLFNRNKHRKKDLSYTIIPLEEIDDTNPVFGKVVVFTGALSAMSRKEAFQIVANLGGTPLDSVTTKTNYLVIGNSDFAKSVKDGKTTKIKTAEAYQKKGREIAILSENSFFDMISEYISE